LEGELVDDEKVVRSFLRPLMQERRNWSEGDQAEVSSFLLDLGYHSSIVSETLPEGGVRATINLQPATLVRHIEVLIASSAFTDPERFKHPLFADEIGRRMTLRPGNALAADEATRSDQLLAEAERLRLYLINDGFYEAEVTVGERPEGRYESHIVVNVVPGPPYFLGTIEVVGNNHIDTKEIVKTFHHDWLCVISRLCFGQRRFSRQVLLKDIQTLVTKHQKRGFPGVRIQHDFDPRHSFQRSDKTVNFTVTVRERRQIDVTFEGNTKNGSDAELTKHLTLAEVASYDDVEVEASADAIREYYQSRGHFEAQVTWDREPFPDVNFERILFYIDEGPRLKVRRVAFTGNKAIATSVLRNALRTRVYKRIIIGDSGGFATSKQLRQDTARVIARYRLAGYRDAKVRLEVSRQKDLEGPALAAAVAGRLRAGGLYVRFIIEEGPQTLIEKVDIVFDGPHSWTEQSLRPRIKLKAGESFLEDVAKEDGEKIRRHYFAKGFPRATVTTTFDKTGNRVVVSHTIEENSPARIGKVAIRGNFKTQDWVILRELKLKEGDLLTVAAAEQAQTNLRESGLFATAQISYKGRENPRQEVVNVLVRVVERHDNRFEYEIGGGYSTESEFFSEAGAGIQNIGGIGARLKLRVLIGQKQRLGEAQFRLPRWVMKRYVGSELQFLTSGSIAEDETERFGDLTTIGGTVAVTKIGRRGFFRGWQLSMRYNYRLRNRDVFLVRPSGNSNDIQETKVTTISSAIGPRLVIDKRFDHDGNHNPLTPASGHRLEFRALFAEDYVLGTDRFVKLGFSGQKFWSPGKQRYFTLSAGLRYDHGIPLGGVSLLPEVERFFAGGDATVRGYEEDHLAVEVIDNSLSPLGTISQFRVVPAGGNIRLVQNLDLQLEVWDDPWLDFPIASAIFLDVGAVQNSLVGVEIGDLSYGAGVALLRWVLPVGSLSIEYAVPLSVKLGDNPRGRFHVNLGVLY
jgi:outer membrane protein insertion porin family